MNGVVPESQSVQPVRLGQAERDRLRYKSARLGLHVQDVRVHVDADSPDVEKVADTGEENVFPGADGVGASAAVALRGHRRVCDLQSGVDGVARLVGLGTWQTAALKAWAALVAALAVREEDRLCCPGDRFLRPKLRSLSRTSVMRHGSRGAGARPGTAWSCTHRLVYLLIRPRPSRTYVTWWVRQRTRCALIRIPVRMHEQRRKVTAAESALAAQGRPVTAVYVAVRRDMTD